MTEDTRIGKEVQKQMKVLCKGAVAMVPEGGLVKKLTRSIRENKPLKVKLGLDPTAADLHLGHTVVLQKLRDFQNCGHQVQLVIGDWTARVGDPTGRASMRKALEPEEIMGYAKTYAEQAFRILDQEKTEISYNSQWLSSLSLEKILHLTAQITVARMLEREDFSQRYQERRPIGLHEFLYPLLQGYDSVMLGSDVELGGTDQTFNLLMGRQLQKFYGQEEQVIMTLPLLVGLDGTKKMSKSLGNHVGIAEEPENFYGKIMSTSDELMLEYYLLVTDATKEQVEDMHKRLQEGTLHPRDVKMKLAYDLVQRYHGSEAAKASEEHFRQTVQNKQIPDEIPEYELPAGEWTLVAVMEQSSMVGSRGEARRLIRQGAVRLNGERWSDEQTILRLEENEEWVLQAGKRRFLRIKKARS